MVGRILLSQVVVLIMVGTIGSSGCTDPKLSTILRREDRAFPRIKVVRIAIRLLKSYDSTNPRQPVDPSLTVDPILLKVGRITILLLESYGSTNPQQPVDPNRTIDPTRRDLGQFFLEARLC